jgi:hypothetical protein
MKRPLLALALTSALLAAHPADAYVRTKTGKGAAVSWPRTCVTVIARVANPPANLTPQLFASAAHAAAAAWNNAAVSCTSWNLTVVASDTTSEATIGNDGVNNMVFRTSSWSYDPRALAITTVFAQETDGMILDADVELNAVPPTVDRHMMFRWGDLVSGEGVVGVTEDLQNTLTHELGHFLGLDHNCYLRGEPSRTDHTGRATPYCDDASAEEKEATMFASVTTGDTARRTLAADDVAGVCAIYPTAGARCSDEGTGCAMAPARPAAGAWALLPLGLGLALVSARRRRRRPRG